MCPGCGAGPMLNEHCNAMNTHHGDCPTKARGGSCNFTAKDSAVAAALAKLSEGARVSDVLPKCPKCRLTVLVSGCGVCGMLFEDRRWDTFPAWEPDGAERLALEAQGRGAARLLAVQVRAEAATLLHEQAGRLAQATAAQTATQAAAAVATSSSPSSSTPRNSRTSRRSRAS